MFWVNVPIGVFGTVGAYLKLRETGVTNKSGIDWWGNVTFGVGLVMILVGLTYGLLPHGHHNMGWTGPWVLLELIGGGAVLALFGWIESRVPDPMFRLERIREILAAEDRLAQLRAEAQREISADRRGQIVAEAIVLNRRMREQVRAKLAGLEEFLAQLEAKAAHCATIARELGLDEATPARPGHPVPVPVGH